MLEMIPPISSFPSRNMLEIVHISPVYFRCTAKCFRQTMTLDVSCGDPTDQTLLIPYPYQAYYLNCTTTCMHLLTFATSPKLSISIPLFMSFFDPNNMTILSDVNLPCLAGCCRCENLHINREWLSMFLTSGVAYSAVIFERWHYRNNRRFRTINLTAY